MKENKSKILFYGKIIFARCWLLYLVIGILAAGLIRHQRVILKTLDYLQTYQTYIVDFARERPSFPKPKLQRSIHFIQTERYYRNLVKLFPRSFVVNSILGYTYAQMGEISKAIRYYKKAVKLDNRLFGLNYNLGLLYYVQKKYPQAKAAFEQALKTDLKMNFIYPNVIDPFMPKEVSNENYGPQKLAALKQAYTQCQRMIALCSSSQLKEASPAIDKVLYFYIFDLREHLRN